MASIRCFLGDEDLLGASDAEIQALVEEELERILGLRAQPLFGRVARWPRSMAQYTVGHRERLEAIRARLARWPGLLVAGNAYEGIGVPDCVRMGRQAARAILAERG
jgi:oxygen-dependent protoporphyrinogen oxidase